MSKLGCYLFHQKFRIKEANGAIWCTLCMEYR